MIKSRWRPDLSFSLFEWLIIGLWACTYPLLVHADITVSGPPSKIVEAKSLVTLVYTLEATETSEVELALRLPEGWVSATALGKVTIDAAKPLKKLVTISIPASATAQKPHVVTLVATASDGAEATAQSELQVSAFYGLDVQLAGHSTIVWAGEPSTYRLTIHNRGNGADLVLLQIKANREWALSPAEVRLQIDARSSADVDINITPTANLLGTSTSLVRFTATSLRSEQPVSATAQTQLEALPRSSSGASESLHEELPVRFETKMFDIGERGFPKTRFSAFSSGKVGDNYRVLLDASVTAFPDNATDLDTREQYGRLDISHASGWRAIIGDSELWMTKLGRDLFGTGLQLTGGQGPYRGTVFLAQRHKAGQDHLDEYPVAANVQYHLGCKSRVGVSMVHIDEALRDSADPNNGDEPVDSSLASLYGKIHLTDCLAVFAELGKGEEKSSTKTYADDAWLVGAGWFGDLCTFTGEVYNSGAHYPGTLTDRKGALLTTSCRATKWLSVWGEHEVFSESVEGTDISPQINVNRSQTGFYTSPSTYLPALSVSINSSYRQSDLAPLTTDHKLDTVTLSANKRLGRYHALVRTDWSRDDDRITPLQRDTQYYLASVDGPLYDCYLTLTGSARKSTYVPAAEQLTRKAELAISKPLGPGTAVGKLIYNDLKQVAATGQQGLQFEMGYYAAHGKWNYDLRYRNRSGIDSGIFDTEELDQSRALARVAYRIRPRHSISAYLDVTDPTRSDREVRSVIQWNLEFKAPVPFVKCKGRICGKVKVAGTSEGVGMVPIWAGDVVTYTNSDGSFRFPPMPPQSYSLNVDQTRLPAHLIVAETTAQEIHLARGVETCIDIDLGLAGQISGVVFLDSNNSETHSEGEKRYRDVRITLWQGEQMLQEAFTSRRGIYHFNQLPPGIYTVAIDPAYLSSDLKLLSSEKVDVEVTPHGPEALVNFGITEPEKKVILKQFSNSPTPDSDDLSLDKLNF